MGQNQIGNWLFYQNSQIFTYYGEFCTATVLVNVLPPKCQSMPHFLAIIFSQLALLAIWSTACLVLYARVWRVKPVHHYGRVTWVWAVLNLVLALVGWVYLCIVATKGLPADLLAGQMRNYGYASVLDIFFLLLAAAIWLRSKYAKRPAVLLQVAKAIALQSAVLLVLDGVTYYLLLATV